MPGCVVRPGISLFGSRGGSFARADMSLEIGRARCPTAGNALTGQTAGDEPAISFDVGNADAIADRVQSPNDFFANNRSSFRHSITLRWLAAACCGHGYGVTSVRGDFSIGSRPARVRASILFLSRRG